jgi:hypothetical protein
LSIFIYFFNFPFLLLPQGAVQLLRTVHTVPYAGAYAAIREGVGAAVLVVVMMMVWWWLAERGSVASRVVGSGECLTSQDRLKGSLVGL